MIWKAQTTGAVLGEMCRFNVRLLTSVIITVYVMTQSESLSAAKVFPMFAIINILSGTVLGHMPWGWKAWMEVSVAAKRIEDFLLLPELAEKDTEEKYDGCPEVKVSNFTAQYEIKKKSKKEDDKDKKSEKEEEKVYKTVLEDISVDLSGNKLLAVVGPVGAGKVGIDTCGYIRMILECSRYHLKENFTIRSSTYIIILSSRVPF